MAIVEKAAPMALQCDATRHKVILEHINSDHY
jgi:hypothetical protein